MRLRPSDDQRTLFFQWELTYEGENAFSVTVNYWKSEKAVVKEHIKFIESNKMVATGRYRYLEDHFLTESLRVPDGMPRR